MRSTLAVRAALAACTLLALAPAARAQADAVSRAAAEIRADEEARMRGDSLAWTRVAPGFLFGHSTGDVDDLAAFLRFRARGAAASARAGGRGFVERRRDAAPPVERLDGDLFVRSRLLGDSAAPGVRPGQSRVLDVYVRRDGRWLWLAHQTSEVRARWAEVPAAAGPAAEYAGTYATPDGRRRTYARRGDGLVQVVEAGLRTVIGGTAGGTERRLIPLGEASFGYEGLNATVTFVRDRSGRVVGAAESSQVGFTHYARTAP